MKIFIVILVVLLLLLNYRLWFSEGSFSHRTELQQQIDQQQAENTRLRERNQVLALEVEELKSGLDSIEERAREQMGMIKKDETFFMIVKPENNKQK